MKSQKELSIGLKICIPNEPSLFIETLYGKVKIHGVEYWKIKIYASCNNLRGYLKCIEGCKCTLDWAYIPVSNVEVKEGVSIGDL
jgi:hypothetical protein